MTQNKQFLKISSFLFLFTYLSLQVEKVLCQQDYPIQTSNYKILKPNKSIQVNQKSTAYTYKLDLYPSNAQNQKYLVIDINLIGLYRQESSLIICLNFEEDILKDKKNLKKGEYNCTYTDNTPRIMQNQKYLLITNTNDQNYQLQRTAYLTVIYQKNEQDIINIEEQLTNQLQFFFLMYYFNSKPCHQNCNGSNGVCNEKTGQCICNQNFFNFDCGVKAKELYLMNINDATNVIIQPQTFQFLKINVTHLIQNSDNNDISLVLKKFNGKYSLNFEILINKEQLPTIDNHDISLQMDKEEIKLQNIKQICKNSNQQLNETYKKKYNNQTSQDTNCIFIIKIDSSQSTESIILRYSFEIEEKIVDNNKSQNIFNDQNLNKRQDNRSETKQVKSGSNTLQPEHITIIAVIGCFLVIIVIGVILYMRFKNQKKSQNIIISNTPNQNQISSNQINLQINQNTHLEQKYKIEQKKKLLVSKRSYLQDKLMPNITLNLIQSSNQLIQDSNVSSKNQQTTNQNGQNQQFDQEKYQPKYIIEQSILRSKCQQCCSICLDEFQNENKVRLTICNHIFHSDCFTNWLNKSLNCPICRQSFEIMDMIDYQVQQLCKINQDSFDKLDILNERNKIQSLLHNKNYLIFQMSEQDFANIFSFFFKQSSEQLQIENPIKDKVEDQNINFSENQSPIFNFLQKSSSICDNSQFKLIQQCQNDSLVVTNNKKLIQQTLQNKYSVCLENINNSPMNESFNSANLFLNLNHLKIDKPLDSEKNNIRSDMNIDIEKLNNLPKKTSLSLNHINHDFSVNQHQDTRTSHIMSKIMMRIKRKEKQINNN